MSATTWIVAATAVLTAYLVARAESAARRRRDSPARPRDHPGRDRDTNR
ncbi:hypothetical protein ACFYVL_36025 [Streptomyces sp. NPDC004111]